VGGNDTIRMKSKKIMKKMKSHSPETGEIVALRNDMDYHTPLTQLKKETYKNPSRIRKQSIHPIQIADKDLVALEAK
jgi:hypothetical protein